MMDTFEDHCWKDVVSQEIMDIYQPYQRKTYVGERPALLAIDLYNLVYRGGPKPVHEAVKEHKSACGIFAYDAIKPTKELFALARSKGIPVIYTTTETRKEVRPAAVHATNRQIQAIQVDDYEIYQEFRPEAGDLIIYKERASGFYGTPLVAHLTRMGIGSLIVCGESTSGCVRASVVDAYSNGFHVVVVEECCFDRSPLSHKVNLFDMHHKYADVMHLDEVKMHLQQEHVRRAI
ncbi:MAG: isochorismatase family protein [Candidatus Binatia bacterium]